MSPTYQHHLHIYYWITNIFSHFFLKTSSPPLPLHCRLSCSAPPLLPFYAATTVPPSLPLLCGPSIAHFSASVEGRNNELQCVTRLATAFMFRIILKDASVKGVHSSRAPLSLGIVRAIRPICTSCRERPTRRRNLVDHATRARNLLSAR